MTHLTYHEIGALLCAIGEVMMAYGVCAGAAQDGYSDDLMVMVMGKRGITEERARELCRIDVEQAVVFADH
ncbi:hypothetical protein [Ralstonia solanacearum]|uniref:hypothetical protein n=1 Tax=Ralstonia solanacearum TaxID=305 RepID=UPI001E37D446|nr:hypothetical protein [Ralstonia solanacearum]